MVVHMLLHMQAPEFVGGTGQTQHGQRATQAAQRLPHREADAAQHRVSKQPTTIHLQRTCSRGA